MIKQSFAYILPADAQILILGSLPGDLSIMRNQYYAHPQNRFWKLVFEIFQQPYTLDYENKLNLLHERKIALWDVCASAYRPGSMDTDISAVIPNDIESLLNIRPTIKQIYFNGQKAQKLFDKHFIRKANINYSTLPSSSPANAQYSFAKLVILWEVIQSV